MSYVSQAWNDIVNRFTSGLLDSYTNEAEYYARQFGIDMSNASVMDGEFDAFRHAYVSGEIARDYGYFVSKILGDTNEIKADFMGYQNPYSENMDYWNNFVGRSIGERVSSEQDLALEIYSAMQNGLLITSVNDPNNPTFVDDYPSLSNAIDSLVGFEGIDLGFDFDAFGEYGYDDDGYDMFGYDSQGYDRSGFDALGYDREGYDRDGFDLMGFNRVGIHRNYFTPVVIDLDGNGVAISSISDGVYFDVDADGVKELTSWMHKSDGVLALDRNDNGLIDDGSEISFTADLPGASTDLEGLRAYDANSDNRIDARDPIYASLIIWIDSDRDGISTASELHKLDELGVDSISLEIMKYQLPDNPKSFIITGVSSYSGGRGVGLVGDLSFGYLES